MDFWIVANQSYDVFSLRKYLDPINRVFSGIYTTQKSFDAYYQAKYNEQTGEYSIERIKDVGDFDDYMSIRAGVAI